MTNPYARFTARVVLSTAVLWVASAAATAQSPGSNTKLVTAQQIVEQIQSQVGVPRREQTVDTFNAGDPETPVTGIAVTMMATFDVLKRAAAGGRNLVITHEPTFYNHQGNTADLEREQDAVFRAKMDFIKSNRMVVWRFHDSWHDRRPDGILTGMVRALGWEAYQQKDPPQVFVMPETTLGALASQIKQSLNAETLRFIGDPSLKISRVALAPGFGGFERNRRLLQRPDVQVEVIGEGHEWEIGGYAADAVTASLGKGLIVIGHIPSEQAGMDECARWLKTFLTDVPVEFVPARHAYTSVK
jgi:putative NIF3 family GTP cyclohydrolase 1 type 2